MNTALIIIAITSIGAVSTAVIQNRIKKTERNILDEVAFRQYKINSKITEKAEEIVQTIDATDEVQAGDLADVLNKLENVPEELKKVIIQQLIIPSTLGNRR